MQKAVYNTKQKGELTFITFEEEGDYIGVCLNFNLVEYGKEPVKLEKSIEEAALSYLEAVRKKGLSDGYLNVGTEKKYIDKLKEIDWTEELNRRTKRSRKAKEPTFFTFKKQPYYNQSLITP